MKNNLTRDEWMALAEFLDRVVPVGKPMEHDEMSAVLKVIELGKILKEEGRSGKKEIQN